MHVLPMHTCPSCCLQVTEVVLGGRRSQSLKEPLRRASHSPTQDILFPSRSLPAGLGQAAAPGSLNQHLSESARRAAAACQALSCSTSKELTRHDRRYTAHDLLPCTSPPRAAASASQAQSFSSQCAGDARDRHTSLDSVAATACSSRASDDEARVRRRAASASQTCQGSCTCGINAQNVRGSSTLESVVGALAPSSASSEARDCRRAASACFSPPSMEKCSSSPPKSVAEVQSLTAATDVAATTGQSEAGRPSGESLQATAAASASRCSSNGRSSETLRVLVAEDNVVNRKVLVRLLAHIGFHADAVGDGLEALQVRQCLERLSFSGNPAPLGCRAIVIVFSSSF